MEEHTMNKQQFLDLGLSEELATKAEVESKKELETYIPKTRFDEVNNSKKELEKTVKERDTQLEKLKRTVEIMQSYKNKLKLCKLITRKKMKNIKLN